MRLLCRPFQIQRQQAAQDLVVGHRGCEVGPAVGSGHRGVQRGMGLGQPGPQGGHGLDNMRRRAQVLGATLSVQPHPDGGTAVTLSKPADWPESPRSAKMAG